MTLFRKNYKEAMNDIKPDAAFVESVIAASKKRRPPLYTRYVKYAAAAAAAVVVVSGTILATPLLNRVEQDNGGVISETTVTETTAPANDAAPLPTTSADGASADKSETRPASEGGANSSGKQTKPSQDLPKTAFGSTSDGAAAKTAPSEPKREVAQKSESEPVKPHIEQQKENNTAAPKQQESNTATSEAAAESADSGEAAVMKSIVMGEADEEVRENKMPADMAPYREQEDVYSVSSAAQADIADTDIPTPSGYRCTSARPNGYTFVNDAGAVITVTINYGGEERAPYIEENGQNIYAVFTSFGLSVTINASGAERESVEEIINSLR